MSNARMWTKEQLEFLSKNYEGISYKELSEILHRPIAGIQKKVMRLKLGNKYKLRNENPVIREYDGYLVRVEFKNKVYIHREVMENHLNRTLLITEIVHHKDGDKKNNCIDNLEILTRKSHMEEHYKDRNIDAKGRFV